MKMLQAWDEDDGGPDEEEPDVKDDPNEPTICPDEPDEPDDD